MSHGGFPPRPLAWRSLPPEVKKEPGITVLRRVDDLRRRVASWRQARQSVGLVPTMGGLHDGHLALVRRALQVCDRVVATLFVNPSQFGPDEDFGVYPRDEAADKAILDALGVDALFAPSGEEMYREGFSTSVKVAGISEGLCGAFRPLHFGGVATVVTKLLLQCLPDVAFFGEKDYQQLQVVRRLVADLDIPVRIEGVETVREADGLAMSSRNAYLSREERMVAPALHRVLRSIAKKLEAGGDPRSLADAGKKELKEAGFARIDYLEVCDAETLEPIAAVTRPARVLAAAHLGKVRLIDNLPVIPER